MKKKPAELADILGLAAGKEPESAPKPAKAPTQTKKIASAPIAAPLEFKQIQGAFDPSIHKQFSMLAIENDISKRALLAEALNELFKKYGKPQIAE